MNIFMTGGTGFVGTYLTRELLDQGHHVVAVGSRPAFDAIRHEAFAYVSADTTKHGAWQENIQKASAIINLAGRNIFHVWTKRYKRQILESRILTTRHLVEALPSTNAPLFLNTSAAGYYGDRGNEKLTETASPGNDFLARVCIDWEKEALRAREKGARVALMRFGVVLGKGGGALAKMIPAFRLFLGGPLGSGRHWFPWIHISDLAAAVSFLLANDRVDGPLNFTAPGEVRYREYAQALGRVLKRPALLPAPAPVIRLLMGELGKAMMASQRAVPEKLLSAGFLFNYPDIESALREIVGD